MSDQMRKEFEEFAARKHGALAIGRVGDYYSCDNVRNDWIVWQASRAAIVVELPDWSEYDTPRQAIDACGQSLTEAGFGVSYK
jgi:hypothetical protein